MCREMWLISQSHTENSNDRPFLMPLVHSFSWTFWAPLLHIEEGPHRPSGVIEAEYEAGLAQEHMCFLFPNT